MWSTSFRWFTSYFLSCMACCRPIFGFQVSLESPPAGVSYDFWKWNISRRDETLFLVKLSAHGNDTEARQFRNCFETVLFQFHCVVQSVKGILDISWRLVTADVDFSQKFMADTCVVPVLLHVRPHGLTFSATFEQTLFSRNACRNWMDKTTTRDKVVTSSMIWSRYTLWMATSLLFIIFMY